MCGSPWFRVGRKPRSHRTSDRRTGSARHTVPCRLILPAYSSCQYAAQGTSGAGNHAGQMDQNN